MSIQFAKQILSLGRDICLTLKWGYGKIDGFAVTTSIVFKGEIYKDKLDEFETKVKRYTGKVREYVICEN